MGQQYTQRKNRKRSRWKGGAWDWILKNRTLVNGGEPEPEGANRQPSSSGRISVQFSERSRSRNTKGRARADLLINTLFDSLRLLQNGGYPGLSIAATASLFGVILKSNGGFDGQGGHIGGCQAVLKLGGRE